MIYGQEFTNEIFGVNVVYPIKNKQNHASMENKHCLNIKMGSSLSPYAKTNGSNWKNNKEAAQVVCRKWKIKGKKCDISAVVKVQVVYDKPAELCCCNSC